MSDDYQASNHGAPILYSFRRCPYAIRARLALYQANIECEVREVLLADKPAAMLAISPKGTVPVLQLAEKVLDESLEIMLWADQQSVTQQPVACWSEDPLLLENDSSFKYNLDRYKYFDRHPEHPQSHYFLQVQGFLNLLEQRLIDQPCMQGQCLTLIDMAIFPFIRQCYMVDQQAFMQLPIPNVQRWLQQCLTMTLFASVMTKYQPWQAQDPAVFLLANKP